jgi:high-affinity iron transporter
MIKRNNIQGGLLNVFPGFVIMFRETLEAALVVGIVMSFLVKTGKHEYKRMVFLGVLSGVAASVLGAVLFNRLAGGFSGKNEALFEGITMIVGTVLLTTMIFWLAGQKNIAKDLENRVAEKTSGSRQAGLFLLVFVSILREGIESVIFLTAVRFSSAAIGVLGPALGVIAAVLLGYLFFVTSIKINIKKFFNITGIILILFAAGLLAQGVHELQEAHVIPLVVEHVWDINPRVMPDGSFPALHENGYIGSVLKGLFGYNGNPSLFEVLGYAGYCVFVIAVWAKKSIGRKKITVCQTA